MENLTKEDNELEEGQVEFIPEGSSFTEQLLRSIILGYQEAFNKENEKNEVQYTLTITNHKIATPDGNKDIAYLRLDRGIRPKNPTTKEEEEWFGQLIHQEIYYFKSMQERVNPKAPWKEQLFVNALARMCAGGLEYAELLRRLKQQDIADKAASESKIEVTSEMPKPLTKEDQEYKEWLANERKKEGL